ncbi:alanine racemase [Tropicibacter sp. Alg240-R139]|uniref:alanine racemase n=1 Tax=Tropicibacter sp. Alg240-R139 TaxID=2305991 RepID=UPI0013E084BA|nr:alanine racemase [Tropicibacter sp. Alg240-R139]
MPGPDLSVLSAALRDHGLDKSAVVVDLDALDHNIETVKRNADPGLAWRLVAKSLPSLQLLNYVQVGLNAPNLMVFSEQMLCHLLRQQNSDLLVGRPMPSSAARRILCQHPKAATHVQWLVDSTDRLAQFAQLSQELRITLRVNLEIDVGLHRGGFSQADIPELDRVLRGECGLKLSGLMGYEPHLSKLPRLLVSASEKRFDRSYGAFRKWADGQGQNLCYNTGGSSTFHRYGHSGLVNDLSFGSVLVLPSDFDTASTIGFVPAVFVATPVLKVLPKNHWPGLEAFAALRRNSVDIAVQGGYFMGQPVHPKGYAYSGIFGRSTNQEIWTGRAGSGVAPGDIALIRPTQSEFVMNLFGPILAYRRGQTFREWTVLPH